MDGWRKLITEPAQSLESAMALVFGGAISQSGAWVVSGVFCPLADFSQASALALSSFAVSNDSPSGQSVPKAMAGAAWLGGAMGASAKEPVTVENAISWIDVHGSGRKIVAFSVHVAGLPRGQEPFHESVAKPFERLLSALESAGAMAAMLSPDMASMRSVLGSLDARQIAAAASVQLFAMAEQRALDEQRSSREEASRGKSSPRL